MGTGCPIGLFFIVSERMKKMLDQIIGAIPSGIAECISFGEGDGRLWSVICHRCDTGIGVMSADTLLRAILATWDRGGVLCPNCRRRRCEVCGWFFSTHLVELHWVQHDVAGQRGKYIRVCEKCLHEAPDIKPVVGSSPLV